MITSQGIGTSMHAVELGGERVRRALELVRGAAAIARESEPVTATE